jgi:hypothetical protein
MKKLILLFLFPFFLNAQNLYVESNFGVANIDGLGVFPGASVLFGKRFEKPESNFLFDMQVGLAFPSIITAKIGGGVFLNKEKKSAVVFGVRPWPFHLYSQINFNQGKRGQWIVSVEAGGVLLDDFLDVDLYEISLESLFIANFGYRWNIGKK